ncbi:hypothetical protein DPX16_8459 [Anabarilius grahami]|uniref:Uncharacterized protein n=1 Tax=Anabarilius grahami TaxID=495550 RepID=A0A3N0Z336_ANAGA|nr:hypothetical protein DPX16_8459 [Anabarilius grahami]
MGSEARLVEKEIHQGLERGCLGNSNSKIPNGMGMGASSHTCWGRLRFLWQLSLCWLCPGRVWLQALVGVGSGSAVGCGSGSMVSVGDNINNA